MVKLDLSMKWVLLPTAFLFAMAQAHGFASRDSKSPQTTTSKKVPSKTTHSASSKRRRTAHAQAYQLHPDADRYQQIQQALTDKGYFKGDVNGQWSDDSVDALKRFQADQKLEPDGKINSLTLIGLGLGPKRDGTTAGPAPTLPAPSVPAVPATPVPAPATTPPPQSTSHPPQ